MFKGFYRSIEISIHAPREGCDPFCEDVFFDGNPFQSTHPVRGATRDPGGNSGTSGISIHAPREGCDYGSDGKTIFRLNISIHAPREGCDVKLLTMCFSQSISIHAPREGCDQL